MNIRGENCRKVNPRQNSSILSKITFWYTLPLLLRGFKHELVEEDLYEVLSDYKSKTLGDRIERDWNKLKKPSIFQVVWNITGKYYILLGFTKVVTIMLNVLRPIVTAKFLSYFVSGQTEESGGDVFWSSLFLIALSITETFYRFNYYMLAECLAIKLRAAICSLIYKKSLNLSVQNLQNAPFGKITILATRDVSCFDFFFYMFNEAWTGFVATIIICYYMYQRIGLAILVIIFAHVMFIPCLALLGIKMASLKTATSEKTDARIGIFREMLCKIKSSKMYVWENLIAERVSQYRKKEMEILFKMYIGMFVLLSSSILVLHLTHYCTLMACIWLGQTLTAETMYFVANGFQSIYFNLTVAIPYATFAATQMAAALKRIQAAVEALDTGAKNTKNIEYESNEPKLEIQNWTIQVDNRTILKNINLDLAKGLTLLLGHAFAGKSVMLLSILREFEGTHGSLHTKGRISYAPQKPWLFPSTIRQNIIFGAQYDEKRYQRVIEVCDLQYDFEMFENCDDTIIAEQGINLSKGQQIRICLARAVYKKSDIYLLDDCLSNLDPLVSDVIFKKCIMGYLKNKLVVLVTNNLKLVPFAKNVITLADGEAELSNSFIKSEESELFNNTKLRNSLHLNQLEMGENMHEHTKLITQQTKMINVYEETKKAGSVSLNNYKKYVNLGGGYFFVFIILCIFVLGQIGISYKDKLISTWADLEQEIANTNFSINNTDYEGIINQRNNILYIYTAVIALIVIIVVFRAYMLFLFTKKASVSIHKTMINSVINATMHFFDDTFIGNIVNRFSADLVVIDENISFILLHMTAILFETIGVLVLILFVNLSFLIPILVFFGILILLRHGYLKSGRALRRLEATTRNPIVGYFNATLKGLHIIKIFQAQNTIKVEFDKCQDLHSSATYSNLSCLKAYVFVVDNLTLAFVAVVILNFVLFDRNATAGDVGLAVSQASMLCMGISYGFHKWAELETQMTSAERAFEYTDLKQERKTGLVMEKWPNCGAITFENVFLSFDNCKSYVLNNLNFVIKPGQKIGIVGRTGAGKSSIISALFRLYEVKGDIIIDGVNIKNLDLHFLRSKLSVIPQDSLIFNGTLRYNIDPTETHSDEELWKVVETVLLKTIFPSLDTYVVEEKMSFAQKQLICLARVLLSQNRILLLDEITENGDSDTESLIYDLVDKHFEMCTVVTITHKMRFVMNCDKVLVMDRGEIVEYDSPQNLLHTKNGVFYKMAKKSGLYIK